MDALRTHRAKCKTIKCEELSAETDARRILIHFSRILEHKHTQSICLQFFLIYIFVFFYFHSFFFQSQCDHRLDHNDGHRHTDNNNRPQQKS